VLGEIKANFFALIRARKPEPCLIRPMAKKTGEAGQEPPARIGAKRTIIAR